MAEEKNFENKIKSYLKEKGYWFVKFFANRNTKKGVPDLIVCVNGRFVGIETKKHDGKPTELQLWNIKEIRKNQGIAIVGYPQKWEQIKRMLDDIMEGKNITVDEQMNISERRIKECK